MRDDLGWRNEMRRGREGGVGKHSQGHRRGERHVCLSGAAAVKLGWKGTRRTDFPWCSDL